MAAKPILQTLTLFLISTILLLSASPAIFAEATASTTPTEQQLQNIIEALMGTQDFKNWASTFTLTDPSTFPVTATIFIPSDDQSLSNHSFSEPFLSVFSYHIVPQQLTFSVLQTFPINSRIPTLLPNETLLVTNNSRSNFTINDVRIVYPDLYINGAVVLHGIGSVLNYSVYGDDVQFQDRTQSPSPSPDSYGSRSSGSNGENGESLGFSSAPPPKVSEEDLGAHSPPVRSNASSLSMKILTLDHFFAERAIDNLPILVPFLVFIFLQ